MNTFLLAAVTLGERVDSIFYNFDLWVFSFFGHMQCGFLTAVAKIFTSFGDEMFVIPMAAFGLVLCLFKKTRKYGAALIFSIVIGTLITNVVVKPMFLRIRPYNTLQGVAEYFAWYKGAGMLSESDYSFPSGHTTAAFEIAMSMCLCFKKDNKKFYWVFPVIALCTMGSRVYLMVHYASDVLAGFIVGTFAGCMGYLLATLACKLVEKSKFLDKIDVTPLFKKVNPKVAPVAIVAVVVGIFCLSYIPAMTEGGESAHRCAYVGEYDCMNEAKVDDEDYPPIDGKEYCKIHWKQLSGVKE
ncbi:phosphatase PAP2 family protein [uncultured Eubacterium sp.]|uniref:phosphatase PAP2 family protein n=1 Tax=uncultured Eubacterium sp. TaxID=165185 RepID=UPI00260A9D64|nr:phosphatase PAP2 family protein [uncultured Eubacterium sp.]